MSSLLFESPSGASLADRAYLSVRTLILKGTYPLGVTLVRRDLAQQFGMSIVPVAEALARLDAEGLVENRPRVGTIVSVPTPAQIRGRWVVREALEAQAARLFAQRASPEERSRLWGLAEEFDREDDGMGGRTDIDPETLFEHRCRHMRLHLQIPESAGAPELRKAIELNHVVLFHWMHNRTLYDPRCPTAGTAILRTVPLLPRIRRGSGCGDAKPRKRSPGAADEGKPGRFPDDRCRTDGRRPRHAPGAAAVTRKPRRKHHYAARSHTQVRCSGHRPTLARPKSAIITCPRA